MQSLDKVVIIKSSCNEDIPYYVTSLKMFIPVDKKIIANIDIDKMDDIDITGYIPDDNYTISIIKENSIIEINYNPYNKKYPCYIRKTPKSLEVRTSTHPENVNIIYPDVIYILAKIHYKYSFPSPITIKHDSYSNYITYINSNSLNDIDIVLLSDRSNVINFMIFIVFIMLFVIYQLIKPNL